MAEYRTPLGEDPAHLAGAEALGVDETSFPAADMDHHTVQVNGLVDGRTPRLFDAVPGSSGGIVAQWIGAQSEDSRAGVQAAALDSFRGYTTALTDGTLHATSLLDVFRGTKLGFDAVDAFFLPPGLAGDHWTP